MVIKILERVLVLCYISTSLSYPVLECDISGLKKPLHKLVEVIYKETGESNKTYVYIRMRGTAKESHETYWAAYHVAGSSLNSALKKGNRTCAILNLSFLESDCFWCPDLSRDEGAPTDPI